MIEARKGRGALRLAGLATIVLTAVRVSAADRLGFGDAEALYAAYAFYPQAVYLDHPGLIGLLARALGDGAPPSPEVAHRATALLAGIVPWLAALAARALGASWRGAAFAALALLVTPVIAVGLFGMTPDLLLALFWYTALGSAAAALTSEPGSIRALGATLSAGAFAGLAFDAKVSGALLVLGLCLSWASKAGRAHLRTIAPWAALLLLALIVSPVVIEEVERGFPMLRHRLVDTPHGGPSLRNLGALFGGQLLYLTPPIAICALLLFRDLARRRNEDAGTKLLFLTTLASSPLLLLALSSRVAEPHWVTPVFLALPLHFARRIDDEAQPLGRLLTRSAVAFGVLGTALIHLAVLVPFLPKLLGKHYVPRYDLGNDMHVWRDAIPMVERALAEGSLDATPPIVVGPHWIVCAQLRAALPASVLVGCDGERPADFETWLPRSTWEQAPVVLYVTDDRFEANPISALPEHSVDSIARTGVRRGGVQVRRVLVVRMTRMGAG